MNNTYFDFFSSPFVLCKIVGVSLGHDLILVSVKIV